MTERFSNANKISEILNKWTEAGAPWGGYVKVENLLGTDTCNISLTRVKNRVPNLKSVKLEHDKNWYLFLQKK